MQTFSNITCIQPYRLRNATPNLAPGNALATELSLWEDYTYIKRQEPKVKHRRTDTGDFEIVSNGRQNSCVSVVVSSPYSKNIKTVV